MPEIYSVTPVGFVVSALKDLDAAPMQGNEGAPDAWIQLEERVLPALHGVAAGDELILLTWFHLADRDVLQVHPRSDPTRPLTGIFATRSPDRPNPIGLHRVTLRVVEASKLLVGPLEAVDGTPIIDIKPVLGNSADF